MGMGVFLRGAPVRGPAGVADPVGAFERRFVYSLFEIAQLSGGPAHIELAIIHHGNARGIIASIFQPPQAVNDQGYDFFRADVTDDSTHGRTLPKANLEAIQRPYCGTFRPKRKAGALLQISSGIHRSGLRGLLHDLKTVFLNDRVSEHFARNTL